MSRINSKIDIAVRCFESVEEIRELNGYQENNPLTKQSYCRILGYYNLPLKLLCCLEKENGNLCRHEHGKGWVVEKQDGTCTLLGKDCANDKFGADPGLIKDILNYTNAIRRQARLTKIQSHLDKRLERTETLKGLRTQLDALYSRTIGFLNELGSGITARLQDMQRSRLNEVVVTGVRYREYVEKGRTKRERSTFQHRLGTLNGLAIVSRESYVPIYIAINNLLAAFDAASKLDDHPKKGEIDALVGQLDDFDRVLTQGRNLLECEALFVGSNMELLCYLIDDRAVRYKCARVAMRKSGLDGSKDQAKTWFSNREAQLRQSLNVDHIEIR